MPFGVGVKEVVRPGIVLVDASLDEPHAEDTGVEVEVLLRRAGNRGDVMKTVHCIHLADVSDERIRLTLPLHLRFPSCVR